MQKIMFSISTAVSFVKHLTKVLPIAKFKGRFLCGMCKRASP